MIEKYPCSGEINSTIENPAQKLKEIEKKYLEGKIDKTDGLSVEYDNLPNGKASWRFNLRLSNTEPIIRLNVETKGNKELLQEKTDELLKQIRG